MAKFDYSADSAPLPPSSLVLQVRSDWTEISRAPLANPAGLANGKTCRITRLIIG